MKKINNTIVEAIEFLTNNPNTSLTKTAQLYSIDRHTLSKYVNIDLSKYSQLYEDDWYSLDERELEAINYYINSLDANFSQIKQKFGYKNETFKKKLEVCGINSERRYIYQFNRELFKEIKTEQDAYWLGFILADGYINEDRGFLNIKLGAIDKIHLEKFCEYAQCEKSLIKETIGGFGTLVWSLTLNSHNIVDNLKQYGLFQAKSTKETPWLEIPLDLKKHYIRGIIDGDGWICKTCNGFGLVGSYEVVKFVRDYVDSIHTMNVESIYEHGTIKKLNIKNIHITNTFISHLYGNANIYLDRKMDLAREIMNCHV